MWKIGIANIHLVYAVRKVAATNSKALAVIYCHHHPYMCHSCWRRPVSLFDDLQVCVCVFVCCLLFVQYLVCEFDCVRLQCKLQSVTSSRVAVVSGLLLLLLLLVQYTVQYNTVQYMIAKTIGANGCLSTTTCRTRIHMTLSLHIGSNSHMMCY
jgi:hypothetical protein